MLHHPVLLKSYQLKYCKVEIYYNRLDDDEKSFIPITVTTSFPFNHSCCGTREINIQNITEARSQGYKGSDEYVVAKSLIEHNLLHNLMAEVFFDRVSYVKATESGLECYMSWDRYLEEAMVLGFQSWANTFTWNRAVDALEFYSTEWSVHKFQYDWAEVQKEIEQLLIALEIGDSK